MCYIQTGPSAGTQSCEDIAPDLREFTAAEAAEWTETKCGVMKAMGEEHRSCNGRRTNFPCIVQGLVQWEHRGVTKPAGTKGGRQTFSRRCPSTHLGKDV